MTPVQDWIHKLQYRWWMRGDNGKEIAAELNVANVFQPPIQLAAPFPSTRRIVRGVDVSTWQGAIDFSRLASRGVEAAYIRACNGIGVDTRFSANWQNSRSLVKRGAYLYFLTNLDPVRQADKFYETVMAAGDPGELPPALDLEHNGQEAYPQADYQVRVMNCLLRMEQLWQRVPAIYSSAGWLQPYITRVEFQRFLLWIANWKTTAPRIPQPFWQDWYGWQYIVGIGCGPYYGMASPNLDLDLFNIFE